MDMQGHDIEIGNVHALHAHYHVFASTFIYLFIGLCVDSDLEIMLLGHAKRLCVCVCFLGGANLKKGGLDFTNLEVPTRSLLVK